MQSLAKCLSVPSNRKFVSLYCGAGGLDLGFISEGFQCIGAFDIDAVAVEVHNRNLGRHAAIANLSESTDQVMGSLTRANIIIAGPPCQGFSTAGRNNPEDDRNLHLSRVAELASKSSADVVVIENVRGLLAKKNVQHLHHCISMLENAGFKVAYRLFDLSEYGVSQARKRVIVVGTKNRSPIALDSIPRKPKKSLKDAIGESCHDGSDPTQCRTLTMRDLIVASHIAPGQRLTNVRCGTRSVHTWDIPEVFGKTSEEERLVLEVISRVRRQIRVRDFGDADPVKSADLVRILGEGVFEKLTVLTRKGFVRKIDECYDLTHTFNGKYKRLEWNKSSPTVDTRFIEPRYFLHPDECRGFSIGEMAALQGFPCDFEFPKSLSVASRLIGNAVPPTFGAAIARQVRSESCVS